MSKILQATNLAWSESTATSDFEKCRVYTVRSRGTIETNVDYRSLSWLSKYIPITCGGVKLVVFALLVKCLDHSSRFHMRSKCQLSHKSTISVFATNAEYPS